MKTALNRIAAVALVLLLLAGVGLWWWSQARLIPMPQGRSELTALRSPKPDKSAPTSSRKARARRQSSAEQCSTAMLANFRAHAASLKQRQDAASQLGYALTAAFIEFGEIEQSGPGEQDVEAIERRFEQQRRESQLAFARARALAPGNPDILWLAATQCGVDEACRGVREELLEAEPDNAAAWLREMTWARMRSDDAAVELAFQRASEASRYDLHAGASQLAFLESFASVPMPAECEAENVQAELRKIFPGEGDVGAADIVLMYASSLAAMQTPAYMDIYQHCSPGKASGLDAGRRAACGRILEKMASGDTLIEQSIALHMLVELAGDGDDAMKLRERYRNNRWLIANLGKPVFKELTMEDYTFDEASAMQRALEAAGRWPPPADWLPQDERARSLILTGRPPPPTAPN